jgi:hypothetical protein
MNNRNRHRQKYYVAEFELIDYGISLKHAQLKALMESGKFPIAIQVSERRWAWKLDEILNYVESRPKVNFDAEPKSKKKPSPTRPPKVTPRVKAPAPEQREPKPEPQPDPAPAPVPALPPKRRRARL